MFRFKMSEAAAESSPADKLQAAMENISEPSTTTPPVVESPPVAEPIAVNPAWNDILSVVPDVLHEQLKGKLSEWDRGVQKRFEEYKPFEEFKSLNPDQIRAGQQLYTTLNQDPRRLYEQLGQYLGQQSPQQQQPQQQEVVDLSEESDDDFQEDPRITELQNSQRQMLEYLQGQENQRQQKDAEAWMDQQQARVTELLKAKGIEPDWGYILPAAVGGISSGMEPNQAVDQAVAGFESLVAKYRPSANSTAPLLMAPGSAMPASPPVDIGKMNDKDHKNFAIQLLGQALKDT